MCSCCMAERLSSVSNANSFWSSSVLLLRLNPIPSPESPPEVCSGESPDVDDKDRKCNQPLFKVLFKIHNPLLFHCVLNFVFIQIPFCQSAAGFPDNYSKGDRIPIFNSQFANNHYSQINPYKEDYELMSTFGGIVKSLSDKFATHSLLASINFEPEKAYCPPRFHWQHRPAGAGGHSGSSGPFSSRGAFCAGQCRPVD